MKKIKIAMIAANLELNGISSVIMNYCKNIDLDKFEITIFAGKGINENYKKECDRIGIQIVELPIKKKNKIIYYWNLLKNMKSNYFDIIHAHGNSATMFFELFIGYMRGIETRIAHSHNTVSENMKLHKMLFPFFKKISTKFFACGKLAGDWIFGKDNYIIIQNGISVEKFKFDSNIRDIIRDELCIKNNEILLGHVGRINKQKNQEFLLEIFERIAEKNENIKLLIIGTGPDYEKIKNKVSSSKFKNRIILYGESDCPEKFYMAMDMFVFPSKYEGMPVTLLEAQISGLQCIVSDVITSEVILSSRVKKVVLGENTNEWEECINKFEKVDRNSFYDNNKKTIDKFEIKNCVKLLEQNYLN